MAREYVGAGWRKQTNSGIDYINIKINEDANVENGEFLKLYKAREKKSDNSPDYNLCRETQDDNGNQNARQSNQQGRSQGARGQGNYPQQQRGNQGGNQGNRPQNNQNRQQQQQQQRRNDPLPQDDGFDGDDVPF